MLTTTAGPGRSKFFAASVRHAHFSKSTRSGAPTLLTLSAKPTRSILAAGDGGHPRETDHGKHLRRTFIIQAEGYYPDNQESYRYGTPNPAVLAGDTYQHNVWIYDNDQSARENPGNESDLTRTFFREHGYEWEPQLVMSRFARIVNESGKDELVFFYFENLADHTKKPVADFPEDSKSPEQQAIQNTVDANSKKAFSVKH